LPASGRSMTIPAALSRCSEKSKVSLDAAVVNILIPTLNESNLGMGLLLGEAFDCSYIQRFPTVYAGFLCSFVPIFL